MRSFIAVLAAGALLAGCSSSGNDGGGGTDGPAGSITVDAASSLTEAFDSLKATFESAHSGTTINISYGASSDLATQIDQGAPVDVFASASTSTMDGLGGQAVHPTNFVTNTLEIAVPPGNPAGVAWVADLAKPGVKVAVCDPEVPCGAVAQQVFDNAGITVDPAANLADVKSTLAAVESGEVDAGLVYVTDVRAAGDQVEGVVIPANVNASTTYPIAVLKDAKNPVLAQAWVDFVLSPAGRQALAAAGFEQP
ncbi:MAG: molybdate transport system substrate-binding protein [Pseudonocardiales bacterium]|jgi:molybdate transport system substrate-binding protein|nr:molybdate transport system substrate-binding protein [Pseudonocardiales bacterium]